MFSSNSINLKHFDTCTIEYLGRRLYGRRTLPYLTNADLSPCSSSENFPGIPSMESSVPDLLVCSLQINCLLSSLNDVYNFCSVKQLLLLLPRLFIIIVGSSQSSFTPPETKRTHFVPVLLITACHVILSKFACISLKGENAQDC